MRLCTYRRASGLGRLALLMVVAGLGIERACRGPGGDEGVVFPRFNGSMEVCPCHTETDLESWHRWAEHAARDARQTQHTRARPTEPRAYACSAHAPTGLRHS